MYETLQKSIPDGANYNEYKTCLEEAYEAAPSADQITAIANSQIKCVKGTHFQSIEEMEWRFEEGDTLFVGPNGAGKSTVAELIYWTLTGEMTKDNSVKAAYSLYSKKPPTGWVEIEVGDQRYAISRSRTTGPVLDLYLLPGEGETVPLNRGTVKDTQKEIYNRLGLDQNGIKMVCYFSTNQAWSFSDLGGSDKQDLMGRIVGVSLLDSVRESVKNKLEENKDSERNMAGQVSAIDRLLKDFEDKIRSLKGQIVEVDMSPVYDLLRERDVDSWKPGELEAISPENILKMTQNSIEDHSGHRAMGASNRMLEATSELSLVEQKEKILDHQVNNTTDEIKNAKQALYMETAGKCSQCEQDLPPNSEALNKTQVQIEKLFKKLDEIRKEKESQRVVKEALQDKNNLLKESLETEQKIKEKTNIDLQIIELIENNAQAANNDNIQNQIQGLGKLMKENKEKLEGLNREHESSSRKASIFNWLHRTLLARSGPVAKEMNSIACNHLADELNSLAGDPKVYSAKVVTDKNIEIEVSFRGKDPVRMSQMSGGERKVNDIFVMIALINIFSNRYGLVDGPLGSGNFR